MLFFRAFRCHWSSFESTYEELKLIKVWSFNHLNYSFESTYEELKPQISLEIDGKKLEFWKYLWGIETLSRCSVFLDQVSVLKVPMRNWNYVAGDVWPDLLNGFESTYEELKLHAHAPLNIFGIVLKVPMRNWNERIKVIKFARAAAFRKYLWGIETLVQFRHPKAIYGLGSTYEELKLRAAREVMSLRIV